MSTSMPSLYVSHGAPDLLLSPHPAARFLKTLGERLPLPAGIVVISAHWQTRGLRLTAAGELVTIHDFAGFSRELYAIRYAARAEPWLVNAVVEHLSAGGRQVDMENRRGLDHGAWVPLHLMYPGAPVPVVQLSLNSGDDGNAHIEIGRALAPLKDLGVLVLGSGSSVHNLQAISQAGTAPPAWAVAFEDWLESTVSGNKAETLADVQNAAPHAAMAHPTREHFWPLLIALGAGGGRIGERLHHSFAHGSLGMSAWSFGGSQFQDTHRTSSRTPIILQ